MSLDILTKSSRDLLLNALSDNLDTRDKRFMFLKCMFKDSISISKICLEGPSFITSWNIYEEFRKQQMLGSLIACMNSVFDSNLFLELEN